MKKLRKDVKLPPPSKKTKESGRNIKRIKILRIEKKDNQKPKNLNNLPKDNYGKNAKNNKSNNDKKKESRDLPNYHELSTKKKNQFQIVYLDRYYYYSSISKINYRYKKGKIYIQIFFYNINAEKIELKNRKEIPIISSKFIDCKEENNNIIIHNNEKSNDKIFEIKDIYYNKKEGFYNNGSTCYFNSFLQILIHVPGLINSLKDYSILKENSLLNNLLNLADYPSRENLYYLRNKFITLNPNYKYYSQDDSQEFGADFLRNINNELSDLELYLGNWNFEGFKIDIKKNEKKFIEKYNKLNNILEEDLSFKYKTIINEYFYYYETELIICNNKIINIQFYGDVDNQLSFDNTNEKFSKNTLELIDLLNKKYLTGKNKLIKLPIIFNITLLRAIIEKPLIKTKIKINDEIDLKNYLDKDLGNYSKCTEYTLYALNVCYGKYKRSGHYISYILINNKWFKFDDTYVNIVDKKSIENDLQYIYGIYYINKEYLKSLMQETNNNKINNII